MNIDPYILTFSALTVVATIYMGFWSARKSKTASDFFVAGRSVSVGWNASAISGEYLSAASFMGVAGMVMSSGYDALWYPVCYACGYLFLLLFIAGPLRRFGAYTIPDFAEGRFDSPVFRKIAVVFVLFIGFFYTMPQMKGAGTTLAYIFQDVDLRGMLPDFLLAHDKDGLALKGLPYWAGVVLVGAVITLNVALGGMKGITLVQAFQYWAKMFAISVPIFVLMAVYGHYGKQISVNGPEKPSPDKLLNIAPANTGERTAKIAEATQTAEQWPTYLNRKPLPQKAPVDSTWLLPFGPLTTKAATAATPKFIYSGDLFSFTHERTSAGFRNWMRRQFARSSTAIHGGEVSIKDLAQIYASKTLAREAFGPESYTFRLSPTTATQQLQIADVSFSSDSKIAEAVRSILATNGVTVFREGNAFTVAATKELVIKPVDPKPYALLYTYSLIIALVCGTAGLPHILVRFYTNPDGTAAKKTTMWVMILIGVFYVFPPVFGVIGRNLLPDLYAAAGAKGTDKIVLELPRILNERYAPLGSILSGITCAGAFAAFMSTFSGLLVSMTGALAHDVYGRILRPKATADQRMRMFKIGAVIIGAVAIVLGMQVEQLQINFMVGQAFAIAAASYFPLLFMAVWWRKLTMKGAAAGMLTGGSLALIGISLTSFSDLKWIDLSTFWAANPLLRILCEQPAIWAVPLAITLMVIVSKFTQREVPSDIRMKMLVLHAPEQLGLKQEYIQEHQPH